MGAVTPPYKNKTFLRWAATPQNKTCHKWPGIYRTLWEATNGTKRIRKQKEKGSAIPPRNSRLTSRTARKTLDSIIAPAYDGLTQRRIVQRRDAT